MIENLAEKVVNSQIKKPHLYIAVFIIITLVLLPGIFKLFNNVEPSLEKVLPGDIQEIQTMNYMRSQFGADMIYLLVHTENPVFDARNHNFLGYIDILSEKLRLRENIVSVNNAADLVKQSNQGILPDSTLQTKEIIKLNPLSSQYFDPNYQFSIIMVRSDTGASAEVITKVIDSINEDIDSLETINPGSNIQLTGFNAIDKATFEVMMMDFTKITLLSMLLVTIVVLLTFKSFIKGFMPLTVVMFALIWTMGIIGYLNLTITVVTMVAAAMILGLGIDFGIHVVHGYFELRKSRTSRNALKEIMRELLRAMIAASLTTVAGFLALLFGVLPAMKTLGIVLAIGILSTLVGAVVLLPVLIYLYDGKQIFGGKLKWLKQ
ncbi:MAG: MMPL family transporter [Nanoarchaeota archaeon]|nr:MMPL family transporter [Nanoarchaeota archaeon]